MTSCQKAVWSGDFVCKENQFLSGDSWAKDDNAEFASDVQDAQVEQCPRSRTSSDGGIKDYFGIWSEGSTCTSSDFDTERALMLTQTLPVPLKPQGEIEKEAGSRFYEVVSRAALCFSVRQRRGRKRRGQQCQNSRRRGRRLQAADSHADAIVACAGDDTNSKLPLGLHTVFDPAEISPLDQSRFKLVRELQGATRNKGKVNLMWDEAERRYVACKRMPNHWIRDSHADFTKQHPSETECPWNDIDCHKFLGAVDFPYGCALHGVYRDGVNTDVVTAYAAGGDLLAWHRRNEDVLPGPAREALVRPIALQLIDCVRRLHDLNLTHRDVSMENCLLLEEDGAPELRIIDFGQASTQRYFRPTNVVTGKESYQAPELHDECECDAFLCDAFAVGVTLYCMLASEYPWVSTKLGKSGCFDFVRRHGFNTYADTCELKATGATLAESMSEPVLQLLEGLLTVDPAKRLTLGEADFQTNSTSRRSARDLTWLSSADF